MTRHAQIRIELGRGHLTSREAAELAAGSAVELDTFSDDRLDLYVRGRLLARGYAVVVEGNLGVRIDQVLPLAARASAI
jgi:flagellar motor switch/type III secretory pathway protein FliN